jgi:HSP20 family molecular chaperone IbpA
VLARKEEPVSRISLFNSPLLLGFDQFERTLDRIGKSTDNYPPYNIEQLSDSHLRIVLAVAGFASEELEIKREANQLTIRGRQPQEESEKLYLHHGIAARQFQRSFMLADGLEITGANLANGLLEIDVVRPPVQAEVLTIPIASGLSGDGRVTVSARTAGKEQQA